MRKTPQTGWRWLLLLATVLVILALLGSNRLARAGGPLFVGSPTMGTDGQPITWDTSVPVAYRADGGNLGTLTNAQAIARVQTMFQVWQNVPTANIAYANAGPIQMAGSFADGDVDTVLEFSDVLDSCDAGTQSPIIFDADGSLFSMLGLPSGVIGFAGRCLLSGDRILSASAVMNGRWTDGNQGNGELTAAGFDQAFTHEFGHFSGLGHSQINVEVFNNAPNACSADNLAGLPLMFPFLYCQARTSSGLPMLAPDDMAWISRLYPETNNNAAMNQQPFTAAYAFITGTIFFSDGITHAQGVNVIARVVNNPSTIQNESRRVAVSVVSGYLFTGNPGQNVTGDNPGSQFGSRNPALIGTFEIPVPPGNYTVEVESVDPAFVFGSGVGPLRVPIPAPGPKEFWNSGESDTDNTLTATTITVTAGQTVSGINIILNGTPPRFDAFESAQLRSHPPVYPSPRHKSPAEETLAG